MEVAICTNNVEEDSTVKQKPQNNSNMTSSTTSMTSSLSSPVDSGVQLLDSESEATSVMSASGTGCEMDLLISDNESSMKTQIPNKLNDPRRLTVIDLTESNEQTSENNTNNYHIKTSQAEIETNELKCQMDLFEKEFGIASIKEYFQCSRENVDNGTTLDLFSENLSYKDKLELYSKQHTIVGSNSSPCLKNNGLLDFVAHGSLNKSFSDDVFEMEHPIQGKLQSTTAESDLMNVSLTSYELLDYTSQNLVLPVLNDPMNVSMSEEVNENLCTQLKSTTVEESIPQEVPVIEPEPKATEEQIVYRRQRKKKSKSDTPKKRVSFHEDILNSTKIDDIHINHGFITHEPDVSFSFFQRGFIRKPDVVKGRYSWAAEGDAPYYEKQVSNRKTNSDMYVQNQKYSSTSSSSTGSISSSIDEEDSSDENVPKKNPSLSQPKSSCLKKTSKKKTIDTKIVHEEITIPRQKSENNLLDTNIFGSLKNILNFSTSVPLAERGVPEGQEDITVYTAGDEKSSRRRSCTNFSFLETDDMVIKEEPVKRRGNLNLEVAKSNFRLSRSEGFYPNYPVDQQLPPNIILCDSNVYEHKGISYSYEYDNFQKTFEQQNKPKSSTLYQLIMKEFNFFRKKSKEEPEKEENEEGEIVTSPPPKKEEETGVETSPTDKSSKSLLSTYASSSKLDWSDNDATISEFSEATNSRHLNSPKKRINRTNHYSTQSSFKISSESEPNPFLSRNEAVSRPSTSKSSLIDRFLRNVTLKKILDAKSAKRHKERRNYLSLYVRGVAGKFSGYDEEDRELEKEIINGLKKKEANAVVYDKKMVTQLKREVFRSQMETFMRLFMVRSAYTSKGDTKPLLAILTNAALYITSLMSGGRYRNHFFLPYVDLNTILIGPNSQTILISNFKQDMQCMITTGCAQVTNDFITQLGMAMRKDANKPCMPAVKQLTMHDMVNLRKTICKQTAVQKDEEYVYYSIVDIQELSADVEDPSPHGPTKEGPLMFRIKESNARWETAYFILKAGVLYMLSSASNRVPMMVYPLINGACQGARRLPNSPRPHTFQVIVNNKSLQLAAPDEYVASDWLQALIHAANGTTFKDKQVTQSCSLLMTTEHILTVREAFPCTVQTLFPEEFEHELMNGTQALSCASITDLVSFRLPSAEQSWCILEFACREVYECGGDWILYFASNAELESFISTLEVLWEYNNEKGESFPLSTIPETDPLSKKCVDVYMSLKNSWSSNTVHLQFL